MLTADSYPQSAIGGVVSRTPVFLVPTAVSLAGDLLNGWHPQQLWNRVDAAQRRRSSG
jgi:hypothetical protein